MCRIEREIVVREPDISYPSNSAGQGRETEERSVSLKTRKLGLAAYIKLQGVTFLGCQGRNFEFDSDRSENDWEAEYMNTDCYRHDVELMNLRKLLR